MYRTTQPGTFIVTGLVLGLAICGAIGLYGGWHPAVLVVGSVLLVVLVMFRSLTIEIDTQELRCFFSDGLIRRRFPLPEIESVSAVRNKWYYGWGIRLTPHGWMFNVSGLDAVEIRLVSGKRFRVGTDRPHEVVEALAKHRGLT